MTGNTVKRGKELGGNRENGGGKENALPCYTEEEFFPPYIINRVMASSRQGGYVKR